jgi:branched-chain amino acid transport system ATP-binding protein
MSSEPIDMPTETELAIRDSASAPLLAVATPDSDRATAPLLETNGLSKNFRGLKALQNHRIQVNASEIVGVIGPNGSGKSTLFNVITGFSPPSGGKVLLEGKDLANLSANTIVRLGIARTFQGSRLFRALTAVENIEAAAQLHERPTLVSTLLRLPKYQRQVDGIASRALELLELIGLRKFAYQRAGDLPYGLQRRLEIARALATNPRLLMLDEPAAGLNTHETHDLIGLIRTIRDRYKVAVIVVEHDMDLIMNLCERIQVLAQGELICEGTPDEVQNNRRVREAYLGHD